MKMPNLKRVLVILIIGGIGGVLAGGIILPFFVKVNFLNYAVILDKILKPQSVITRVEKETIIISQSNYFSEAIKKVEPNIVAVQSFSGGQLIRFGSGIVLTRDGLIATTNSVVPVSAQVFQVSDGGKIYKAKVALRDYVKNIALISVSEVNFQVTNLKSDLPNLGQKLLIFSKLISFGKGNSFVEEALISSVDEKNAAFEISAGYDTKLYGAALIDGEGTVLGIIDFRNQKPVVLFSKLIEDTLNSYLARSR